MWHLCLSEITMKITPLLNLTTLNYQTKNKIKDNKSTIFLGQIDKDVFIPSKPKSKSLYDYFKNNNLVVRQVSDNIYAGETLATKPESVFEELSCSGIETIIDLRSFDTHNVTNMNGMFGNCRVAKEIKVSSRWSTEKASTQNMFRDCGVSSVSFNS